MRTLNCISHRVLGSTVLFVGVIATLVWLSGDCRLTPALHEKNIELNRTVTVTKVNPGECLVFKNLSLFPKNIFVIKSFAAKGFETKHPTHEWSLFGVLKLDTP